MPMYSRREAIAGGAAGLAVLGVGGRRFAENLNPTRSGTMEIEIKPNGSRPSAKGSADWFTGPVRVDPLFQAPEPARASAGQVTFEPGARTNWHTHPLGQT